MKGKYAALLALTVLAFVVAGIFLAFLPETVPAHYNIEGKIDRFGSKYENLIIPAFALISGAVFGLLAKNRAKKGDKTIERIYLISGITVGAVMNALNIVFLWLALAYAKSNGL